MAVAENETFNIDKLVIKRNGAKVPFDYAKILDAISNAGSSTNEFDRKTSKKLLLRVLSILEEHTEECVSVEDIQDAVEAVLFGSKFKKTARAYAIYRDQHSKMRDITNAFNVNLIDKYVGFEDWQVNENSNMAYSLQGLNNYICSEVTKIYWMNKIYPEHIRKMHLDGNIHIHDLGALAVYCVGWDLQDLINVGFKGVDGKVTSSPAKHFRTIMGQLVNFIYTLQGEAAGAQAVSSFDTLLAPFIKYDNLTYAEVKQAMQEFIYNMNIPTRVGFQSPFSNITMDIVCPNHMKDTPVVIGGKTLESTYGQFQEQMDMINKAFLEVMTEGDANGRVFTFPIPTYNITKDFNWDSENNKKLWEVTAKYGIPYFCNYINSDLNPEDARSMCCRLRLNTKELRKRGGGLFGSNPLTGSIGVVTINLPRLGYLAESEIDLLNMLKQQMDIAKESLEIKRKILENYMDAGLYPYMKFYLRAVKQRFDKYLVNHFSTIGIVGMNELCTNFMDKDITTLEGKALADKILEFMRDTIAEYQESTGNVYNLEATPAEGTSYRLALIDRAKHPDIKVANNDGKEPYYSNSSQLPVGFTDDIYTVLDHQDSLQIKYTGGTVQHLFIGEKITDYNAVKEFIKSTFEKYSLPYISITPTFSICQEHGYIAGEHLECPKCKKECEVYSRVVGYIRPVKQWNKGKKQEYQDRQELVFNK